MGKGPKRSEFESNEESKNMHIMLLRYHSGICIMSTWLDKPFLYFLEIVEEGKSERQSSYKLMNLQTKPNFNNRKLPSFPSLPIKLILGLDLFRKHNRCKLFKVTQLFKTEISLHTAL